MDLTEEQTADLKAKHGDSLIRVVAEDGAVIVFKKPSKQVWVAYQDSLVADREKKSTCFLRLCLECAVFPERKEVSATLDKFPGMPTAIAGELSKLAGLSDSLDIKKL